jgi:glycosyltransferase involved in cell wall biosynthesis
MNRTLVESSLIRKQFDSYILQIPAAVLTSIGKFSVKKILVALLFLGKVCINLIILKPNLVYFTMSPAGYSFYRDSLFVLVIKMFRKKIIIHFHGKGIRNQSAFWLNKMLCKFVLNKTFPICLSQKLTEDISSVYSSKIFIVNNGIEDRGSEMLKEKKFSRVPQLLYLSNFAREKGVLDCISAFEIINKKVEFTAAIIGGDVDLSKEGIKEIVSQKGLSGKVTVSGPIFGDEKYRNFLMADIFIFPTFYKNEAFPIAILEAMQFELPVISTYEGAISEIIDDGINGFLVNRHSPNEIAVKLELLIKDPQLRRAMGKKGREKYLGKYTISQFERNLENVFQEVLAGH